MAPSEPLSKTHDMAITSPRRDRSGLMSQLTGPMPDWHSVVEQDHKLSV